MAIPTDFKGYTPTANTTKSFKLLGSATTGIWAHDVDGTLSAGSVSISLGANLVLFSSVAITDAAIVTALKEYLQRVGAFHEGPGGYRAEATKQLAVVATTCT